MSETDGDVLILSGGALNRMALANVFECIVGFAIGETLVRVIAVTLGWGAAATGIAAAGVAVVVGYLFIVRLLFEVSGRLDWVTWNALRADSRTLLAIVAVDNAAMLTVFEAAGTPSWESLLWGRSCVGPGVRRCAARDPVGACARRRTCRRLPPPDRVVCLTG